MNGRNVVSNEPPCNLATPCRAWAQCSSAYPPPQRLPTPSLNRPSTCLSSDNLISPNHPHTTQDGVSNPADWPAELLKPAPWGDLSSDKFSFAVPMADLKKWLPTAPDRITKFYDVVQDANADVAAIPRDRPYPMRVQGDVVRVDVYTTLLASSLCVFSYCFDRPLRPYYGCRRRGGLLLQACKCCCVQVA